MENRSVSNNVTNSTCKQQMSLTDCAVMQPHNASRVAMMLAPHAIVPQIPWPMWTVSTGQNGCSVPRPFRMTYMPLSFPRQDNTHTHTHTHEKTHDAVRVCIWYSILAFLQYTAHTQGTNANSYVHRRACVCVSVWEIIVCICVWWCCDKVCTVGHLLHQCRFVLNIVQVDCVNSQQSTFVTALWMPNQLEDESVRIVQFPTRVREVKFIALSACAISLSPGGGGVPLCVVGQICVLNKHDTQQKTARFIYICSYACTPGTKRPVGRSHRRAHLPSSRRVRHTARCASGIWMQIIIKRKTKDKWERKQRLICLRKCKQYYSVSMKYAIAQLESSNDFLLAHQFD